jgi:hypothetical protein
MFCSIILDTQMLWIRSPKAHKSRLASKKTRIISVTTLYSTLVYWGHGKLRHRSTPSPAHRAVNVSCCSVLFYISPSPSSILAVLLARTLVKPTFPIYKRFVLVATGHWSGIQYHGERKKAQSAVNPTIHEMSFCGPSIGAFSARWLQTIWQFILRAEWSSQKQTLWVKYQATECLADGEHNCHSLKSQILDTGFLADGIGTQSPRS